MTWIGSGKRVEEQLGRDRLHGAMVAQVPVRRWREPDRHETRPASRGETGLDDEGRAENGQQPVSPGSSGRTMSE